MGIVGFKCALFWQCSFDEAKGMNTLFDQACIPYDRSQFDSVTCLYYDSEMNIYICPLIKQCLKEKCGHFEKCRFCSVFFLSVLRFLQNYFGCVLARHSLIKCTDREGLFPHPGKP